MEEAMQVDELEDGEILPTNLLQPPQPQAPLSAPPATPVIAMDPHALIAMIEKQRNEPFFRVSVLFLFQVCYRETLAKIRKMYLPCITDLQFLFLRFIEFFL